MSVDESGSTVLYGLRHGTKSPDGNERKRWNQIISTEVMVNMNLLGCDVATNSSYHFTVPLSSDDLEEIDRFLNAWCDENGVDKNDSRAQEVASALIDWYATSPTYRQRSKLEHAPHLPTSEHIASLLDRLK